MLVSVLMPVYNEKKYIKEALDSVLSQELEYDLEIIVVDDFSTDGTYEYVKELYENEPRIELFRNTKKGKNNAFNFAYEKAKGDFFILFAGDDILEPNTLQKRIKPLENKKNPTITLCKLRTFSKIKKYDGIINPRSPKKGELSGGCMAMNRNFIKKAFPLPNVLANEDMWLVNHAKYFNDVEIIHVPIIGINYRIHENNSSSKTDPFYKKTASMHNRFIVYSVFLEKYRKKLDKKAIKELETLAAAETLRYHGDWLSILLMKGLSLADRARFIMHSNAFFYWIRIQLFALLSGRG